MLCSAVQRPSAIESNLKSVNAWLPRPVRRQALERGTDVCTKNGTIHHRDVMSSPVGV